MRRLVVTLSFVSVLWFAFLPGFAQKQTPPSGGTPSPAPSPRSTPTPTTTVPIPTNPTSVPDMRSNSSTGALFLNGRVVLDQGTAPPESVIVEEVCGARVRARTRTDLRGLFTFSLGSASPLEGPITVDASENISDRGARNTRLAGCELRAILGGYISSELQLDDSSATVGMKDVGTIVLNRIGGTQSGAMISVTSMQVPEKARKEYDKALKKLQQNNDMASAREHLLKAVQIYPKYAAAWVSLGEVFNRLNNANEAQKAFTQAVEADPNYVPPYVHLAYLSARDRKWEDVRRYSEQAIRLDPVTLPDSHFMNAIANFNLHHLPEAKREAIKAAEIDKQHRFPRIQLLLGSIYESSGERELAALQLQEFLKLEPDSPESAGARARLQRLTKESTKAEKD